MELQYVKVGQTPKEKKPRAYDCPHNEGCRCTTKDCYNCGWNPKVIKIRAMRKKNKEARANG
jgi:hypothetical protein